MDRDGIIDDEEFLKVIELMYEFKRKSKKEYPPEKLVHDIFSRIDENGDKRLTENEFIEGCLAHKKIVVRIRSLSFVYLIFYFISFCYLRS